MKKRIKLLIPTPPQPDTRNQLERLVKELSVDWLRGAGDFIRRHLDIRTADAFDGYEIWARQYKYDSETGKCWEKYFSHVYLSYEELSDMAIDISCVVATLARAVNHATGMVDDQVNKHSPTVKRLSFYRRPR